MQKEYNNQNVQNVPVLNSNLEEEEDLDVLNVDVPFVKDATKVIL